MLIRLFVILFFLGVLPVRADTVLTLSHNYVPEHATARALARFAETVKARSGGKIVVKVHGEASLGNQGVALEGMRNGSLDLAIVSQGPVSAIVPEANAFGLPFLFAEESAAWNVLNGPIGAHFVRQAEAKGLVVLSFWNVQNRHLSNSVRPIRIPDDVAGLTIRTSADPVAVDILQALGAKTREINFSDLYKALQQKVVDGQENPLLNFQTSRLYEVQKYLSLTGHKCSVYFFVIGKLAWDALSEGDRKIVLTAAKEATRYQLDLARRAEFDALRYLATKGVRINKVSTALFVKATEPIYDKWYASPIGNYVRAVVTAAKGQR